jgi:tRNA dimethylallyltransferase
MSIGTAKPTESELAQVKHHFINNRSIQDGYSVGDYHNEITEALATYFDTHDVAILTGGTGMYIHAVRSGLNNYPTVSEEIVTDLEETLRIGGIEMLQNELEESDPEYYDKVDIHNPARLVRALSVIHETGETFTSFQQKEKRGLPYTMIPILLTRDRKELYKRIDDRVHNMMKNGLLAEARELYNDRDLKSLQTVGYNELMRHINGTIDIVVAVELIQRNSRRYAKRQMTWFRKYGEWHNFHPDDRTAIEALVDQSIVKPNA